MEPAQPALGRLSEPLSALSLHPSGTSGPSPLSTPAAPRVRTNSALSSHAPLQSPQSSPLAVAGSSAAGTGPGIVSSGAFGFFATPALPTGAPAFGRGDRAPLPAPLHPPATGSASVPPVLATPSRPRAPSTPHGPPPPHPLQSMAARHSTAATSSSSSSASAAAASVAAAPTHTPTPPQPATAPPVAALTPEGAASLQQLVAALAASLPPAAATAVFGPVRCAAGTAAATTAAASSEDALLDTFLVQHSRAYAFPAPSAAAAATATAASTGAVYVQLTDALLHARVLNPAFHSPLPAHGRRAGAPHLPAPIAEVFARMTPQEHWSAAARARRLRVLRCLRVLTRAPDLAERLLYRHPPLAPTTASESESGAASVPGPEPGPGSAGGAGACATVEGLRALRRLQQLPGPRHVPAPLRALVRTLASHTRAHFSAAATATAAAVSAAAAGQPSAQPTQPPAQVQWERASPLYLEETIGELTSLFKRVASLPLLVPLAAADARAADGDSARAGAGADLDSDSEDVVELSGAAAAASPGELLLLSAAHMPLVRLLSSPSQFVVQAALVALLHLRSTEGAAHTVAAAYARAPSDASPGSSGDDTSDDDNDSDADDGCGDSDDDNLRCRYDTSPWPAVPAVAGIHSSPARVRALLAVAPAGAAADPSDAGVGAGVGSGADADAADADALLDWEPSSRRGRGKRAGPRIDAIAAGLALVTGTAPCLRPSALGSVSASASALRRLGADLLLFLLQQSPRARARFAALGGAPALVAAVAAFAVLAPSQTPGASSTGAAASGARPQGSLGSDREDLLCSLLRLLAESCAHWTCAEAALTTGAAPLLLLTLRSCADSHAPAPVPMPAGLAALALGAGWLPLPAARAPAAAALRSLSLLTVVPAAPAGGCSEPLLAALAAAGVVPFALPPPRSQAWSWRRAGAAAAAAAQLLLHDARAPPALPLYYGRGAVTRAGSVADALAAGGAAAVATALFVDAHAALPALAAVGAPAAASGAVGAPAAASGAGDARAAAAATEAQLPLLRLLALLMSPPPPPDPAAAAAAVAMVAVAAAAAHGCGGGRSYTRIRTRPRFFAPDTVPASFGDGASPAPSASPPASPSLAASLSSASVSSAGPAVAALSLPRALSALSASLGLWLRPLAAAHALAPAPALITLSPPALALERAPTPARGGSGGSGGQRKSRSKSTAMLAPGFGFALPAPDPGAGADFDSRAGAGASVAGPVQTPVWAAAVPRARRADLLAPLLPTAVASLLLDRTEISAGAGAGASTEAGAGALGASGLLAALPPASAAAGAWPDVCVLRAAARLWNDQLSAATPAAASGIFAPQQPPAGAGALSGASASSASLQSFGASGSLPATAAGAARRAAAAHAAVLDTAVAAAAAAARAAVSPAASVTAASGTAAACGRAGMLALARAGGAGAAAAALATAGTAGIGCALGSSTGSDGGGGGSTLALEWALTVSDLGEALRPQPPTPPQPAELLQGAPSADLGASRDPADGRARTLLDALHGTLTGVLTSSNALGGSGGDGGSATVLGALLGPKVHVSLAAAAPVAAASTATTALPLPLMAVAAAAAAWCAGVAPPPFVPAPVWSLLRCAAAAVADDADHDAEAESADAGPTPLPLPTPLITAAVSVSTSVLPPETPPAAAASAGARTLGRRSPGGPVRTLDGRSRAGRRSSASSSTVPATALAAASCEGEWPVSAAAAEHWSRVYPYTWRTYAAANGPSHAGAQKQGASAAVVVPPSGFDADSASGAVRRLSSSSSVSASASDATAATVAPVGAGVTALPRLVRGFLLLEELGRGAFGNVYRALATPAAYAATLSDFSADDGSGDDASGVQWPTPLAAQLRSGALDALALLPSHLALKEVSLSALMAAGTLDPEDIDLLQQPCLAVNGANAAAAAAAAAAARVEIICREAAIAAQLEHPNVVRYITSFLADERLYFVMELVSGPTLAGLCSALRARALFLPERVLWGMFSQLALALFHLHTDCRVVHRDLSPANVLVAVTAAGPAALGDGGGGNYDTDSDTGNERDDSFVPDAGADVDPLMSAAPDAPFGGFPGPRPLDDDAALLSMYRTSSRGARVQSTSSTRGTDTVWAGDSGPGAGADATMSAAWCEADYITGMFASSAGVYTYHSPAALWQRLISPSPAPPLPQAPMGSGGVWDSGPWADPMPLTLVDSRAGTAALAATGAFSAPGLLGGSDRAGAPASRPATGPRAAAAVAVAVAIAAAGGAAVGPAEPAGRYWDGTAYGLSAVAHTAALAAAASAAAAVATPGESLGASTGDSTSPSSGGDSVLPTGRMPQTSGVALTSKRRVRPFPLRLTAKLADFGLARQTAPGHSLLQSSVGTVSYSCPEIILRAGYTDKADVWSLGCVLYQLAARAPPFSGTNPLLLAQRIVDGELDLLLASGPAQPRLAALQSQAAACGTYSPQVLSVIQACLTADPAARPSVGEVLTMLTVSQTAFTGAGTETAGASQAAACSATAQPLLARECNDLARANTRLAARAAVAEARILRLEAALAALSRKQALTAAAGAAAARSAARRRAVLACAGSQAPQSFKGKGKGKAKGTSKHVAASSASMGFTAATAAAASVLGSHGVAAAGLPSRSLTVNSGAAVLAAGAPSAAVTAATPLLPPTPLSRSQTTTVANGSGSVADATSVAGSRAHSRLGVSLGLADAGYHVSGAAGVGGYALQGAGLGPALYAGVGPPPSHPLSARRARESGLPASASAGPGSQTLLPQPPAGAPSPAPGDRPRRSISGAAAPSPGRPGSGSSTGACAPPTGLGLGVSGSGAGTTRGDSVRSSAYDSFGDHGGYAPSVSSSSSGGGGPTAGSTAAAAGPGTLGSFTGNGLTLVGHGIGGGPVEARTPYSRHGRTASHAGPAVASAGPGISVAVGGAAGATPAPGAESGLLTPVRGGIGRQLSGPLAAAGARVLAAATHGFAE